MFVNFSGTFSTNSVAFLFDVTFQEKSGLAITVFSGTLLTLLKVHNIMKSSASLIAFQVF